MAANSSSSSWFNTLVKAVSEVESRLDKVLDIHTDPPPSASTSAAASKPSMTPSMSTTSVALTQRSPSQRQPPATASSSSASPSSSNQNPTPLAASIISPFGSTEEVSAQLQAGFTKGLSSLQTFSSSLSSSIQATATSAIASSSSAAANATENTFFSSMLSGLSGSGSPPAGKTPVTGSPKPSMSQIEPAFGMRADAPSVTRTKSVTQTPPSALPATATTTTGISAAPTRVSMDVSPSIARTKSATSKTPKSPTIQREIQLPPLSPSISKPAEATQTLPSTASAEPAVDPIDPSTHSSSEDNAETTNNSMPEALTSVINKTIADTTEAHISNGTTTHEDSAASNVESTHPPIEFNPDQFSPASSESLPEELLQSSNKELARLQLVVSQRERQLMNAMTENAALNESVLQLRVELESFERSKMEDRHELEGALKTSMEKVAQMELQLNTTIKERDNARQSLNSLQGSLQSSAAELTKQLQEREEKIHLLMEEGEKMSKNELKISTNLKKLRVKETETEKEIKEFTRKLEVSASEIAELKGKVTKLAETERKHADTIKALNEAIEQQAKQTVKMENELNSCKEENSQLKNLLDRARLDLQDARRQQAEANSAAHAESLDREIKANETLHKQLEDLQKTSMLLENSLKKEIFDLRSTLSRVEEEASWKEENFRKEINSLHARIQAADARHEDLFAESRIADRPLVRQIESMQRQHAAARRDWEQIEASLTLRLQEAEAERNAAVENERTVNAKFLTLNNRLLSLEHQSSRERQENSRLLAELEAERNKAETYERSVNELSAKLDGLKNTHTRAMEEAKENFQRMLRRQIQEEKEQWEEKAKEERNKLVKEMEQRQKMRIDVNSPRRMSFTRASTVSEVSSSPTNSIVHQSSSVSLDPTLATTSPVSTLLNGTPNAVIDRLHMSVKQLQTRSDTLQAQLEIMTKTRDELADELVKVTTENTDLKQQTEKNATIEKQYADLNTRYLACLELLGEKTEQMDDLKQSMTEMREAFKNQIEELLKQIPAQAKGSGK